MPYDVSKTISEFLGAAAARQPTPGGGSVTALTGALCAALGEMVVNYSIGKKGLEAFQGELKPAAAELAKARQVLLELMVEDQVAYEAYTSARKLPDGAPDKAAKQAAALLACIRVPQSIAATAVLILERLDKLVSFVNPWLLSDLAVSADLAMATVRCATYSVRANANELADSADRTSVQSAVSQLLERSLNLIQSVAPRVWQRYQQEC